MDYFCRCCEELTDAYDEAEIIRAEKLCWKCVKLTDEERKKVRKHVYSTKHEFPKPSLVRVKGKKTHIHKRKVTHWRCPNCESLTTVLPFNKECDRHDCMNSGANTRLVQL